MQTLNHSDESATRDIDSPDPIYAGRGTPDIHQYGAFNTARWLICVTVVIVMHIALIGLLWIAGVYESNRVEQDLTIALSDAGDQSSVVFIMDILPGVPNEEPVSETQAAPIVESVPIPSLQRVTTPVQDIPTPAQEIPTPMQEIPAPVQEQASLLMPKESNAKEEPVIERKSSEVPQPHEPLLAPQEPAPKLQEPVPKPQEPPPVLKAKPVTKPVQATQPPKKQPLTEKSNTQKSAAEPSGREEASGSSQNSAPASSEGSNASAQVVPKLVKSPKPRYPSESIRLRQEGRVVVNIEVLESGAVGQATIAQSSGFSALDQSALEAVKNWQYASGSGSGSLIKQRVQAGIIFELKNR